MLAAQGSLSYTELMEQLDVLTGILNYHLKVLGELIQKNNDGKYVLSEKGKLASKLLVEFPDDQVQGRKRLKQFWIFAGIIQVVYLISVLVVFVLGYIDFWRLTLYTIWFIGGLILVALGYRVQKGSLVLIKD